MIHKIKILNYRNAVVASFDTYIQDDGADKGRRAKHYVYKDEKANCYWHERRYLSSIAKPEWSYGEYVLVSERVFFGKLRLVIHRDACMPETWLAIAQSIQHIEGLKTKKTVWTHQ